MSVKISKSGAAQSADIASVENAVGSELPSGFKGFLGEHDGAEPETNIFRINDVTGLLQNVKSTPNG
ncbi:MAG: hypothetical protein KF847_05790 [Pirellulales bacterium]|nr:hypothetical protein [Pirellulales bacterium]